MASEKIIGTADSQGTAVAVVPTEIESFFIAVKDSILDVAGLVSAPFVPGLVAFLFLVVLVAIIAVFWRWSRARLKAIKEFQKVVVGGPRLKNKKSVDVDLLRSKFFDRLVNIPNELNKLEVKGSPQVKRVIFAWKEYKETLIEDNTNRVVLNGIRPSVFFNTDDLDAEARGWKVVPGIFVSIGLAATFFGLIAALQTTSKALDPSTAGAVIDMTGALEELLKTASAKFIMSLTGLLCSIVFTIILRSRLGKVEHAIDDLCIEIEKRVRFLSLEELTFDQKKLLQEQKEHSQTLNTQLIEAIGNALNRELPAAISKSISEVVAPMMENVGKAGSDGVGQMVQGLADQFSGDVSRAMGDAATRFETAGARIEDMASALSGSAGNVNGSMEKSISQLTATIVEMREGLSEGANATKSAFESGSAEVLERMNLSLAEIKNVMTAANDEQQAAAGAIAKAAEAFAQRVDSASSNASEQVGDNLQNISNDVSTKLVEALGPMLKQAETLAAEVSQNVVKPVGDLTASLEGFVARLEQGSHRMDGLSKAMFQSTDATTESADVIGSASGALKLATEPVERLVRGINTSAQVTASAAEEISGSLDSQRDVAKISMDALSNSLVKFQDVVNRYDDIDEKLGEAFMKFREEVDTSIKKIGDHADGVHEQYGDALNKLKAVVDQESEFRPALKRHG